VAKLCRTFKVRRTPDQKISVASMKNFLQISKEFFQARGKRIKRLVFQTQNKILKVYFRQRIETTQLIKDFFISCVVSIRWGRPQGCGFQLV
jgi:hypothetical protein